MTNRDASAPLVDRQTVGSIESQAARASLFGGGPERSDGYFLLAVGLAGTALFAPQINWIAFAGLFWVIDIIGYWPGVAMSRLAKTRHLPRGFTYLYNLMHSNSGGLALALGYAMLSPGSFAAALAIPVHLGIDRGILGNRLKRPAEAF